MPTASRQMHLGVFVLGTGNHMAGWRTEGAFTTHMELPVMQEIARIAERGNSTCCSSPIRCRWIPPTIPHSCAASNRPP